MFAKTTLFNTLILTGATLAEPLINDIQRTFEPLAIAQCSDMTGGPSILSYTEGVICDTTTHTLRPLCARALVSGCFADTEAEDTLDALGTSNAESVHTPASGLAENLEEKDVDSTLTKRQNTAAQIYGSNLYYSTRRVCNRCCLNSDPRYKEDPESEFKWNTTHYWGYGVDEPTVYTNLTGGIIMRRPNDTSLFVQICPIGSQATEMVYSKGEDFDSWATKVGVGMAGVVGTVLAVVTVVL